MRPITTPHTAARAADPASACTAAAPAWLDGVRSTGALFAVDLDQRIVHWAPACDSLLGPRAEAIGRPCYELMRGFDARNRQLCRPHCAVVANARAGRPLDDFTVSTDRGSDRVTVTTLLYEGDPASVILHLVRPAAPAQADAAEVASLDGAPLTVRQRQVLQLLAAGHDPGAIARQLQLRPVTVRNHVQGAMERLGARTRLEAVLRATHLGVL